MNLSVRQIGVQILFLLLVMIKVSALHVYAHEFGFTDDCIEHCEHCEQAVIDSISPALAAHAFIVPAPEIIRSIHSTVNSYLSTTPFNKLQGQFFNKPPPADC